MVIETIDLAKTLIIYTDFLFIKAFYGVIFERSEQEAAFSNYRLWESLGNSQ